MAAAVEDVVADLDGLHVLGRPVGLDRGGVEVTAPPVTLFSCSSPVRMRAASACGVAPCLGLVRCVARPVAGPGELAEAGVGALVDHGADRVAVVAGVHAVEDHFDDRLLAVLAFAAGLVVDRLGQA